MGGFGGEISVERRQVEGQLAAAAVIPPESGLGTGMGLVAVDLVKNRFDFATE